MEGKEKKAEEAEKEEAGKEAVENKLSETSTKANAESSPIPSDGQNANNQSPQSAEGTIRGDGKQNADMKTTVTTGADNEEGMGGEMKGMVAVEVLVLPEEFRVRQQFDSLLTIKQVRMMLCKRLSFPFLRFSLTTRENKPMKDDAFLTEWTIQGLGTTAAPLQLVGTIEDKVIQKEYKMPNVLEVMIDADINGHPVVVKVDVEREESKKPFYGGFRNKRNGREYHHAGTQTIPKKKDTKIVKFHRETQTVDVVSKSVQSKREQGTQMARKDLYVDTENDKIIAAQTYFTTEELLDLKKKKALAIQCFIRQCFAWRKVTQFYNAKRANEKANRERKEEAERKKKEEEEERLRRRMNPTTKADFDALYAELKNWKLHQQKSIKESGMSDPQIAEALKELLHKEIRLLQTIDKLRIRARSTNKEEAIKARLELMASPKEWLNAQGDFVEVITPVTTRASELVQLYNGLKLRGIPIPQRIDVIMNVKYTVREFDCQLTRDIQELVNRENDMLSRGRSGKSLTGMRQRLENLFLQFIETPEFNPGAENFQRAPYESSIMTKQLSKASTALYHRKNP
mmetsp:Transcript_1138/g.2604  ORF Transcript_1138/g.2604 Transcript_1138/m.2604 type:complete len:572 (-) Transcript_1138:269-1984(-)|eukprot:CAMPEP_0114523642 /NCGR_PEP_ID=MMETSP0109-20121206/21405_1 /TAXON_ID=29199 /ORGANISM="Chlorarachnion reptans, Strain CCCM449" /LENGTH=571 /DNA_ID=CAMNT_0001704981 /DNA_START=92 /DNA_END=1807 /DNA_ORIENTATION=+